MIAEAKAGGMGEVVRTTGWIGRDEMKLAYGAADIVLVPSLCFDAFPRIVVEAMASGRPVIGTCYGGAPEIIQDGTTGYVVNPLYPEQVAEKIIDLLKNPEKATQFRETGYERIKNEFSLEKMVGKYIVEYESVIQSKKP
jgi:glycosyltransferase involved in cell wall biosynthesis